MMNDKVVLPYIGMAVTLVSWSLIPIFQKQLLTLLSPIEVSFSRFFITGIILTVFVGVTRFKEVKEIVRKEPRMLLLSTIFGPLMAMVLFNYGILTVAVGMAGIILALEPVFTYIFAVIFKVERWYLRRFMSVILALIGVSMVIFSDSGGGDFYLGGVVLLLLSPMVWAMNTIITKRLVVNYSPIVLIAINFFISSILLAPLLTESYIDRVVMMDLNLWGALLFCVFPGTLFGFTVWYWCLRYVSPTTISISFYFIPVLTLLSGVVFLNEQITVLMIVGILVTFMGLYLVNLKYK